MKDNSLMSFYKDTPTKDNVKNYLINFLEKEAVKKVFNKEDVSAVAEARDLIDKAFDNLELLFTPKRKSKEQINEAR